MARVKKSIQEGLLEIQGKEGEELPTSISLADSQTLIDFVDFDKSG